MNLNIDQNYAKALFQCTDKGGDDSVRRSDGFLDENEFLKFFLKLTFHFETGRVMSLYSSRNDKTFSAVDLKNFLIKVQQFEQVTISIADSIIREIITKQGNYRMARRENLLGPIGFRSLLRSRWGNILRSGHETVFQNMKRPLSDYYINSSHNTYLMGTQIKVDVLDGPYGEPCITHRHTLVSSICLKDVLMAIKSYAFKYSEYPLILTIENHCSLQQQQILGNDIFITSENEPLTALPSPHELKFKYILRGKTGLEYISAQDENINTETSSISTFTVDPEISKLISLSQVKLSQNWMNDITKHAVNLSPSISETKVRKIAASSARFTSYTSKHLVKSYPKALRQDSSNFNPMQSWMLGIQSVALNMQTHDENLDLNSGLFRINGNCGYVLKPDILLVGLDVEKNECFYRMIMNLTIISGEYLPKPFSKCGEIIDPYVIVEIYGIPEDCRKMQTKVIDNNGFCPVWNESFKFELKQPEVAILRLCVKDHDNASLDDFIGEFSVPVNSIRPG
ncbi:unnamed protein product [Thelazia callipaeda]|uniref:Phosphoinositide phospholipase C n=1 Tax=Thelazia callipaeda TaxID=103827 RepID=A0A0N5D431_THECL|nr:unnamed protein product [Thelazia callipaeda]